MKTTMHIDEMTVFDKIETMELLWNDLCSQTESIPVQDWHKVLLANREALFKEGKEKPIVWAAAKKLIRDSIE